MKYFKEFSLLQKAFLLVHLFIIVNCTAQKSQNSPPPSPPPPPSLPPNHLKQILKLALFEEDLITELFNLQPHFSTTIPKKGSSEELCQLKVFQYVSEYEEDDLPLENTKGLQRATLISEHPFLVLKMIRRLVHTLLRNTMEKCRSNHKVIHALQTTFTRHKTSGGGQGQGQVERPTEKSLEDALQRILMIHFIYGWTDAGEAAMGKLNGDLETKVELNIYDCLELAKKAMEWEWLQLAYQWMSEATNRMDRETLGEEDTVEIYNSWEELAERASFSNVPEMHKRMLDKRQVELEGTGLHWERYGLCRGELRQRTGGEELVCSYDWYSMPYFRVNPIKVERHSLEPLILEYHDFVGEKELELLKELEFDGRVEVKILRKVNRKIEGVTKLKVEGISKSLHRTLETSLGSFCELEKGEKEYVPCEYTNQGMKTMATFYLHVTDVQMGGYITFPKLDIFIKPEKGSAIFFYNKISGSGDLKDDPRTAVVPCPVIIGRKQVVKWNLQTHKH